MTEQERTAARLLEAFETGRRRVLVLDGAMGTELSRLGHDTALPLWSTGPLLTVPEAVIRVHSAYVAAGADVITANTFRTNPRAFRAAGRSAKEAGAATRAAVDCARQAIAAASAGRPVLVAGSMAPVEDCYHPERVPAAAELRREHAELAHWLAESGVDLFLVETMGTVREARAATAMAVEAARGRPVWVSFTGGESPDRILSGERLQDGVAAVEEAGARVVGANCVPATAMAGWVRALRKTASTVVMAYANGGRVVGEGGWEPDAALTPDRYARLAQEWTTSGARIVGGCCGTSPEHVAAVRRVVDKNPVET